MSPNVASFIGAATIRSHVLGLDDVTPTPAQMDEMRDAGPPGDGGGRARHRDRADLRARHLRDHRGADRALQGRRPLQGHVHLPHAQRERQAARGRGGADPHQPRGGPARGDLPLQGGGAEELGQARRGHRRRRARAPGGPPDHREHVPLHRELDGPERDHPGVGPRRRRQRPLRPAAGPGDADADRRRDARARAHVPHALRQLPHRGVAGPHRQDPRGGRAGAREGRGRHDATTSCSRTAPGSAPSSSR